MPKIVYLEARGRGAFRSQLRSDTLWGILCWRIRQLAEAVGDQSFDLLSDLIKTYEEPDGAPFYISSAFPWVEQAGERTHFLPSPLVQPPLYDKPANINWTTPLAAKTKMRERKRMDKRQKGWISWQYYAYRYAGQEAPRSGHGSVQIKTLAITHNQIDRRRLGTFSNDESGQLFHMNENYLSWDTPKNIGASVSKHGLYFLLDGPDTSRVEGALRLLDTLGLAGDRSSGKGNFRIYLEPDAHNLTDSENLNQDQFSLPKVSDNEANSRLNLSLYHPSTDSTELDDYEMAAQQEPRSWQYKLQPRQGRNVYQGQVLQNGKLLFTEGAIFPKIAKQKNYPGMNWVAGKHRMGHDIYRYGHAFMLNIKQK